MTIALGVFLFAIYDNMVDYILPPSYKRLVFAVLLTTVVLFLFHLSGGTLYQFNISLFVGMGLNAIKYGFEYFKMVAPLFKKRN
ncbi:hypothetical protein HFN16_09780 [Pseudodesulfovibrio sp. zrk46]|nr:hypothetical protein HFN16_09780 [Pseudodesulfovibrio sp. zrk46]